MAYVRNSSAHVPNPSDLFRFAKAILRKVPAESVVAVLAEAEAKAEAYNEAIRAEAEAEAEAKADSFYKDIESQADIDLCMLSFSLAKASASAEVTGEISEWIRAMEAALKKVWEARWAKEAQQAAYDVFLNFRGEDTRKSFTDHLYSELKRNELSVFRDDKSLQKGKPIKPDLLQAITKSKSSIVILSKNYASSPWCLDELVQIMECNKKQGQIVVPVFYGVDPSDVRNQTGPFKEAFDKHELENPEKVKRWKKALTEVGKLSGYHHLKDGHESELVQAIVKDLSSKLSSTFSISIKEPVQVDLTLGPGLRMDLRFGLELDNTKLVEIHGLGGTAKTTIVRLVVSFMLWIVLTGIIHIGWPIWKAMK